MNIEKDNLDDFNLEEDNLQELFELIAQDKNLEVDEDLLALMNESYIELDELENLAKNGEIELPEEIVNKIINDLEK